MPKMVAIFFFFSLCLLFRAVALEVSVTEASRAVGTWLADDPALGCALGRTVSAARTCRTPKGGRFHVVRLSGGGFVVTSADTELEPVVAFSPDGDLVEDARNPLWTMLCADFDGSSAVRASAAGSAKRLLSVSAPSPAEAKWARLLATNAAPRALRFASARPSVSDVRVAPLLGSEWGQSTVAGADCYNLLTPNRYYAGCVATAGAQVMRYFEWPKKSVPSFTNAYCRVDGQSVTLRGEGGVYDWTKMPLVPDAATPQEERLAISGLMRDLGVACGMDYESAGSGTGSYMLTRAWTVNFGYASATTYTLTESLPREAVRRALVSNLDARLPVVVAISGSDGGHAVVGDGYGYSDGTLYYHFNMGWDGNSNAWYAPPDLSAGSYSFSSIDGLVYNIFTERSAGHTICSGRVLDGDGRPVAGATVTSTDFWGEQLTVRTDEKGIYALVLPSTWLYPLPYDLRAEYGGESAERSVKVNMCISTTVNENGTFRPDGVPSPAVNNLVDQDFTLGAPTGGGTDPVDPSDPAGPPADAGPAGDAFAWPIELSGATGTHHIADTSAYTKEDGEPIHSLDDDGTYYAESRSAWYRWTAPGSGSVTFRVLSRRKVGNTTHYLHAMIAAYRGEDLPTVRRVALFDGFADDGSTSVTLNVSSGETYRIAVFAYGGDAYSGYYLLSWEGDLKTVDETQTTVVPVPHSWLRARFPEATDFESCAHATGLNGRPVWESYLLSLNPLDASSDLRIVAFRLENGQPVAEWNVTNRNITALGYAYRLKRLEIPDANLFRLVVEPANP